MNVNLADINVEQGSKVAVIVAADTNMPTSSRRIPIAIPRGQEYFWTKTWQDGERSADADLAAGAFADFDDPANISSWLRGDS